MIPDIEIVIRLFVVCVLTGVIGYEREIHGRIAGLRTHMLVGLGACLIMMTSMHIFDVYQGVTAVDPSRIAAQVISGIGFLGAGTIIRFRASVKGLTTAASLWASSGVGLAVGSGFYLPAVVATVLIWGSLFMLPKFEHSLREKSWYRVLHIETTEDVLQLEKIKDVLSEYAVEVRDIEFKRKKDSEMLTVEMNLKLLRKHYEEQIVNDILQIEGIVAVKWLG